MSLPTQVLTRQVASTSDPLQNFEDIGSFNPFDLHVMGAYAQGLGRDWSLGAALNVTDQGLDKDSAVGLGLDLGLLWRTPLRGLQAGLAAQNLGFPVSLVQDSFALPLVGRAGLSYRVLEDRLLLSTEADLPVDYDPSLALGVEYHLAEGVFAGAGYRYDNIFNPWSLGAGFRLGEAMLEIATAPAGELGQTYRASVSYRWGGNVSPGRKADLEPLNAALPGPSGREDIKMRPLASRPRQVANWSLYVYGSGPKPALVRVPRGQGPLKGLIHWDGRSDDGQAAPPGRYQAVLAVRFESGQVAYSAYRPLVIGQSVPEIRLGVDPGSQVPERPGLLYIPALFTIQAPSGAPSTLRWRLEILGPGQSVFQTLEGDMGDPSVKWLGEGATGAAFVSNQSYQFRLSELDGQGRVLKVMPPMTRVCVFRQ